MLDGMSDSIQRSRIENLHSREVGHQSPTGLIFKNHTSQKEFFVKGEPWSTERSPGVYMAVISYQCACV